MVNTAAASVDDTIAPSSNPSFSGKFITKCANRPTSRAVSSTPAVASEIPQLRMGLIVFQCVDSPPENRMNARAAVPTIYDTPASLKIILPGPSAPANIPIARNSSNAGMLKCSDNLLARTLIINKIATMQKI